MSRWTKRNWTVLALAGIAPLAGCYTTRPVETAPIPGATVLLDLTDQGRVQLGNLVGPSAARIEGVVQARSDTSFMLHVSSVTYLNGQMNRWSGEPLTVPSMLVSRARLREFSRSRTTAVGVGIAAALITLFTTTNFLGSSGGERIPPPPPTGGT